jgi:hypothetical protein
MPERRPGFPKPTSEPAVLVIYESTELEQMSLRTYAAIHLRVPDSGIEWPDKMIEQSRKLDRGDSPPGK